MSRIMQKNLNISVINSCKMLQKYVIIGTVR